MYRASIIRNNKDGVEVMKTLITATLIALNLGVAMAVLAQTPEYDQSKIDRRVDELIQKMTLEEKVSLLSGRDSWTSQPIPRLDIPAMWMADGPHGLRRAPESDKAGFGNQLPATCFPTASAMSATWNTGLIHELGSAIGREAQTMDVDILLAPGVNIKRSPLTGRNFEFYSEDPVQSGEIATAFIDGVQSQGVGTCIKHFAINNQETERMRIDAQLEKRPMHELYLSSFEIPLQKAEPWSIMASYNRINGEYGTQHAYLLHDVLREEFSYEGLVISDWVSVVDRVKGVQNRMNLEMPASNGVNDQKVLEAVNSGELAESVVDDNVRDILRIVLRAEALDRDYASFDTVAHHNLARKVAEEGIVLLKNEKELLPLDREKYKKVLVVGELAKKPTIQGYGSSEVKPTMLDNGWDELNEHNDKRYKLDFALGYSREDDADIAKLHKEAVKKAKKADIVLFFAGLPFETEGADRDHLEIPAHQNELIEAISQENENVAVVTISGSVIEMPWHNSVKAIVHNWLAGQASGGAIARVLLGDVNPSGKLAETFVEKLEDTPSYLNFPGEQREVLYGEGQFVGYRYADEKQIAPLYPFGHGLSYTTFDYTGIKASASKITDKDELNVTVTVKNTGERTGMEVIQLYVKDEESTLRRPPKELKAFKKVALEPGEMNEVTMNLSFRDFAYYDERRKMWIAESGFFEIMVGTSSRDIRQTVRVEMESTQEVPLLFDELTFLSEYLAHPKTRDLTISVFRDWLETQTAEGESVEDLEMSGFIGDMPLIKFPYITGGEVTDEEIQQLLKQVESITYTP